MSASLEMNTPGNICNNCREESSDIFRCLDCFEWSYLCENCLDSFHSHPHLHFFECWKMQAFIGYAKPTPVWSLLHHEECSSSYTKEVIVIDDKGRQHVRTIRFCLCEGETRTLIRYNLWPSSPKIANVAFHLELMKWAVSLLLECQVSVKGFCAALRTRLSKHYRSSMSNKVKDLYKILKDETVDQFRQFMYQQEHIGHYFSDGLDDGTTCPGCFKVPLKAISFDADFQLVRKQSSGHSWNEPKHKGRFFLNQEDVDSFISQYNADCKNDNVDCSDFQAGNNVRSKVKTSKLSETAVFGSACRHEFPQKFFSLRHGERLGYSVYLLQKMMEDHHDSQLCIMYDIACMLHNHLKKRERNDILSNVQLAIPIFHCYGHKMACQLLYSPRRTAGLGLTDGEQMERLWSYLGKFSRITKEMTPENRIDLLVDGLIHYGQKVKLSLGESLVGKLKRATEMLETTNTALDEILQPFPGITKETVREWFHEEHGTIRKDSEEIEGELKWEETYALNLNRLQKVGTASLSVADGGNLKKEEERLTKSVQRCEKKHQLPRRWEECDSDYKQNLESGQEKTKRAILKGLRQTAVERTYLLELVKKYARGQSVAKRLNTQIKKMNTEMRKKIEEFNLVGDLDPLPRTISFDDVKSVDSELWNHLSSDHIQENHQRVPVAEKQKAVDLLCLCDRCKEEKDIVQNEMKSVLQWHTQQYTVIQDLLEEHYKDNALATAVLTKEALFHECQVQLHSEMFSGFINVPYFECFYKKKLFAEQLAMEDKEIEEIINNILGIEQDADTNEEDFESLDGDSFDENYNSDDNGVDTI
ncbi:uncharacterized protein LOC117329255 [Pecten maximus]|uniref:uncharacterized protein LOC117329255 n=1 Tax=Pecten maximus TaxID=6579 RepID=UPI0014588632|nr:uncharacterized protein LOC117329255 [Pecten maximus]